MDSSRRKIDGFKIAVHVFFLIACNVFFILPFLLVIAISISNEQDIVSFGYKLIPKQIDWSAYKLVFKNPDSIYRAYFVTAFQSIAAMIVGVFVMSLCGYALSRRKFVLRKQITLMILFTMLFSGGLVPLYILTTQYLHLGNTIWVYIFPTLCSGFSIIIFRTFFQELPEALVESAKMDGAGEFRIYFQIIVPISKPVIATIALFTLLDRWNDWFTALIYIRDSELYSLQFLLQKVLLEMEFIKGLTAEAVKELDQSMINLPSESFRFAMAVVAAGPVLLVFPFFQKYFARGLTVGSVKG